MEDLEQYIREYGDAVYRFCCNQTGSCYDAEELYQDREPLPPEWNERLQKRQNRKKRGLWQHRKIAAAILLLCLMGVPASVYAYFHYMTPAQVAEEMDLHKLAEQFGKHQDEIQSISSKGYRINYLGIITGKNLEEGLEGAEVDKEKTYIVTAIQKENGKAMTYSDRFFVSPLIAGLEPIHCTKKPVKSKQTQTIRK